MPETETPILPPTDRKRPCPICGEATWSRHFAESHIDREKLDGFAYASRKLPEYMHYELMECMHCDLVYASETPQVSESAAAYEEAMYDSAVEAECAAVTYASYLRRFVRRLPNRVGALDIGAGDGAFMDKLVEAGFEEVVGIEPSRAPIQAAKDSIRPAIRQGFFDEKDYEPCSLALVSICQTIEHVHDPLGMCGSAIKLLKPGGALLIVGHNRRALSARLMGFKSPIFDIEHLQLFSQKSMTALLKKAGFVDAMVFPIRNRYPLSYYVKLAPLPRWIKTRLLKWLTGTRFGSVSISAPLGNLAAIGFKPL